jgi:GNAT superfamily N-acetyltransferase
LLAPFDQNMHLIRYQPAHREALLALHRSAIEGFDLGMSQQADEADLMAIEKVYLSTGGEFLLGFLEDKLMAMGGYKKPSDSQVELRRMRIARELQNKGYGTQLLLELERRAAGGGFKSVCLDTATQRPLTLEFYRKHGYEDTGRGWYGALKPCGSANSLIREL